MNIINKIKNNIFGLFQNKVFRTLLMILFMVFIIKNYTSVFKNINNFKKENNLNSLSVAEIKNSIDTRIVKNKRKEEKEKEKEKQEKITREKQAEIMKNVKIPEITENSRIFIIDFILFNKNEKNILTEMKDMQILVANNNTNPFAKYLRGKKIGEIVIIPISEMVDQKLPKTDIFYKITVKNIKKLTE